MKRALMYASVASMIHQFNMENIQLLLDAGYEVDVACNMECGSAITTQKITVMREQLAEKNVRIFHIPLPRKMSAIGDIVKSFSMTKRLINDNAYDLIHCHSPIGSVVCRLVNRCSKQYGKAKMIYTAHGFHFFKGAPKLNWLVFYPIEKICSYFTDQLITINKEDYALAKEKFNAEKVFYVPGVGVDLSRFAVTVDRSAKRKEIGVPEDAVLLLSTGEVNRNKNHQVIIRALARMQDPNVHYAIAGIGDQGDALLKLAEDLGVSGQVHLLGFRKDIPELNYAADVFCFPSYREGLGLAAIEAMACGLPIVTSNIRGINDYSIHGVTGYQCDPGDVDGFLNGIRLCLTDTAFREKIKRENPERAKNFDAQIVNRLMRDIYTKE